MKPIPVYTFTGFLESGKTKFLQDTLKDTRFNTGERTLIISCEEGEEEVDISSFPRKNIFLETVEDYDDVHTETLLSWEKKYRIERVILELNGMKTVGEFYEKFPEHWQIAQEVMFADSRTIMNYNANMRSLVVDKLTGCEMVVFNRLALNADTLPFHKLARAVNRRVDIIYDFLDGSTQFDELEDPLPFDVTKDEFTVEDDDYALFYRDISEEAEKYDGKTVHFKAQVARLRRLKDNSWFAPGRFVMTCCADDIQFMGLPCRFAGSDALEARSWVDVTAKISVRHHMLYKGELGPVLTASSVEAASLPADEVCTF